MDRMNVMDIEVAGGERQSLVRPADTGYQSIPDHEDDAIVQTDDGRVEQIGVRDEKAVFRKFYIVAAVITALLFLLVAATPVVPMFPLLGSSHHNLSAPVAAVNVTMPIFSPLPVPEKLPEDSGIFEPSFAPTKASKKPTHSPSKEPTHGTKKPSHSPSEKPSHSPSEKPTHSPSKEPTHETKKPSHSPSEKPSHSPSEKPTPEPTAEPTVRPSRSPTTAPSNPTAAPTDPTEAPWTKYVPEMYRPTLQGVPTQVPTQAPTGPTVPPSTDKPTTPPWAQYIPKGVSYQPKAVTPSK
ncbi:hypothetical protein B484DRAFT_54487 [Ochromonadaceae sp. CCMP2298]|nr:hypothetical protein B484DRAFT_54487 [Ochromonadaceae sp. CCMP2298]